MDDPIKAALDTALRAAMDRDRAFRERDAALARVAELEAKCRALLDARRALRDALAPEHGDEGCCFLNGPGLSPDPLDPWCETHARIAILCLESFAALEVRAIEDARHALTQVGYTEAEARAEVDDTIAFLREEREPHEPKEHPLVGVIRNLGVDVVEARGQDDPITADDPCPGEGNCHGTRTWCEDCGDVGEVCDQDHCYVHDDERERTALRAACAGEDFASVAGEFPKESNRG